MWHILCYRLQGLCFQGWVDRHNRWHSHHNTSLWKVFNEYYVDACQLKHKGMLWMVCVYVRGHSKRGSGGYKSPSLHPCATKILIVGRRPKPHSHPFWIGNGVRGRTLSNDRMVQYNSTFRLCSNGSAMRRMLCKRNKSKFAAFNEC